MTYEEREKLVAQIDEKANELKELVSQVEDQRVDFEEDENGEYCYNDIYIESALIYVEKGTVMDDIVEIVPER